MPGDGIFPLDPVLIHENRGLVLADRAFTIANPHRALYSATHGVVVCDRCWIAVTASMVRLQRMTDDEI
ncbi:conserved hypothetical protein [Agrobacterium fabacearum S56]|nr:hypothetical protein [Agrobacterium tumefaciens]UXU04913.1 hypothetical protein FY128_05785 [Agrobacterium tumefaciens]CUW95294.1 conserved hypothetical protein [Agrobacterium fabacearum S56]